MDNFHPIADIFPMMPEAELAKLAEDIQKNGLREPIWTDHGGRIIDGRNRFLACQSVGVEPAFRPYEGDEAGLPAFVLSLNLHRRHLDESQRGLIAGRLANWANGVNQHTQEGGSIDPPISNEQAAEMLNVSVPTVKRAKVVLRDGTPEEIKAVETGTAKVSTTEQTIRKRKKAEAPASDTSPAPKKNNAGARTHVPEGMTLEEWIREIMRCVDKGQSVEEASSDARMAATTFRMGRDIVLLSDRDDLSETDAAKVKAALDGMNETHQVRSHYETVHPLTQRIWGKKGTRGKTDRKRMENFERGYGTLIQACHCLETFEIPHLSPERVGEIVAELKDAERRIRNFSKRISEQ